MPPKFASVVNNVILDKTRIFCGKLNDIDGSKKDELLELFNERVFENKEKEFKKVVELLKDFNKNGGDSDVCENFIEYVKEAELDNFSKNLLGNPNVEGFISDLNDFILERREARLVTAADIAHNHKRYNSSRHARRLSSITSYDLAFGKIRKKSKRGKGKKTSLRKEKRKNGKTRGKKKKN
tara:strand:- start:233 stop:778 length:546 start_codon:yes stop_codon:yes gene_type:complete